MLAQHAVRFVIDKTPVRALDIYLNPRSEQENKPYVYN